MPTANVTRLLALVFVAIASVSWVGCEQSKMTGLPAEQHDDVAPPIVGETTPTPKPTVSPTPNSAAASPQPTLEITLSGAKSQKGVYSCAIFTNREDFEQRSNPLLAAQIPASADPAVWLMEELPAGEYAIAVFHDENENRKLDRHPFGYPTEAYGFSNNARGKLGPPPYDTVTFSFSADGPQRQSLQLK